MSATLQDRRHELALDPELAERYPDVPNPDLLTRIPVYAGAILDVGCGTGALGQAFRAINPRTLLFGIERNPPVAAIAAQRYDAVATVDAEAVTAPFGDRRFDCIVYGDSLEHFTDPWRVLRQHAGKLTDDGVVLICQPNVEHWSLVGRLLDGSWRYDRVGLLDRDHLRWFSLETMREAIEGAGLSPCDVHPRVFDRANAERFANLAAPVLASFGRTAEDYLTRSAPLQYVWRAVRTPRPRMAVAATMLAPVGGVSDLRIVEPLEALATDPLIRTKVLTPTDTTLPMGGEEKIVVLHRPILSGEAGLQRLRRLLAENWVIVTEFDDHPDHFPALRDNPHFTFAGVHALQVSTDALASVLREHNPELAIFSNAIRELPPLRNFRDPTRVKLFFGALNREGDWEPFMPVLNEVAQRFADRLSFEVVHDRAFFDALATPQKTFTPTCDYARYMELLGGCEIAFMPLLPTWFNRTKSDLKFIETGACGAAALASDVVYGDSIEDGRTGLVFRDPAELRVRRGRARQRRGLWRLDRGRAHRPGVPRPGGAARAAGTAGPGPGGCPRDRPGGAGLRRPGAHARLSDPRPPALVFVALAPPRGADGGAARPRAGPARRRAGLSRRPAR